jgi:hypothetical protein
LLAAGQLLREGPLRLLLQLVLLVTIPLQQLWLACPLLHLLQRLHLLAVLRAGSL